jgi:Domain of unknown function (DUF5671)
MEHNTAKHFVLQLGSVITLYLSVSFLIVLLFAIINLKFPDAAEYFYAAEGANYSVRLGIAMLLVFFPTYLYLTRLVNTAKRKESLTSYTGLTKWLMYLSLLIGGGILLGDLVTIILTYLNGEMTTRFILKATVLMVVVATVFYYYLQDARGYWYTHEKQSKLFGAFFAGIVIISIVSGFMYTDSPSSVREKRLDAQQITDLQAIQWQIETYYTDNNTLPSSLATFSDKNFPLPTAPEGRDAYSYESTASDFKLCATFETASEGDLSDQMIQTFPGELRPILNAENWYHTTGRYCFERQLATAMKSATSPTVELDWQVQP